jgi:hypothetical protein
MPENEVTILLAIFPKVFEAAAASPVIKASIPKLTIDTDHNIKSGFLLIIFFT